MLFKVWKDGMVHYLCTPLQKEGNKFLEKQFLKRDFSQLKSESKKEF